MSEIGTRDTKNKLRWRNFPSFLIKPVIEVAHWGEQKYETYNFLKGQYINNCLDAIKRHMEKFEDPNVSDFDEESGLNHMAHVAWNALIICYFHKVRPDLDDRYRLSSQDEHRLPMVSEDKVEKKQNYTPSHRFSVKEDGNVDYITPDSEPIQYTEYDRDMNIVKQEVRQKTDKLDDSSKTIMQMYQENPNLDTFKEKHESILFGEYEEEN